MLCYDELFTRPQCCNCRQEISGLGIECAECHGGSFKICAECFALGAEIGQHKKDHRFKYFDSGSLKLFPASAAEAASSKENGHNGSSNPRWSAREEIRLLDAIEQYGFGNWQDISKHIETRGPLEAKEEFVQKYVNGSIGQLSWRDRYNSGDVGVLSQPIDHTLPVDDGPLSPSLTQKLPALEISPEEQLQLGYMPLRDDYEKEYDNEAETLVAQLTFSPDDDEVEIGVKLALVDMYSRRLRERARRKRVIRDYQLVFKFFKKDRAIKAAEGQVNGDAGTAAAAAAAATTTNESNKKFHAYEKMLQEKLRPFAQFYNCREFDNMIRNLMKEKDLKLRLNELYKYRNAGITQGDECVDYERSRLNVNWRAKRSLETLDEEDEEGRSRKKIMMTQSPVLIQQLLQPRAGELNQKERNEGNVVGVDCANQNLTQQPFFKDDSTSKSLASNSELAILLKVRDEVTEQPRLPQDAVGLYQQSEKLKVTEDLYTANFIPSAHVVTEDDLELCKKINLLPDQFITLKMSFIVGRLAPETSKPNDENSVSWPDVIREDERKLLIQAFMKYQVK